MSMYISIDDERIRIKRSDVEVGGTFWQVDPQNASCVFEVAYRAMQEDADKYGHMYKVLKRGGRSLSIRRNNAYGDAFIFAATGITRGLEQEHTTQFDLDWKEAHDRNNSGEFDDYYLLYAS